LEIVVTKAINSKVLIDFIGDSIDYEVPKKGNLIFDM